MNKLKLKIARNQIDRIDHNIFKLIKKRTEIVKYMLKLKVFKKQIVDHQRIREVLKKIRIRSIQSQVDPRVTNRIWKSMIWSYVDYQKMKFRKK